MRRLSTAPSAASRRRGIRQSPTGEGAMKSRKDINVDKSDAAADVGADVGAGDPARDAVPAKRPQRRFTAWWFLSRVPRVFRLTTYLMVVAFIGAMVAANVGYARMKGSALSFGNE